MDLGGTGATTVSTATVPAVLRKLCDDAAVFPPGSMPLPEAVPAHERHTESAYADLVGPLIVAAPALEDLGPLLGDGHPELAVTVPAGPAGIESVLAEVRNLPADLRALEVVVPDGCTAPDLVTALDRACRGSEQVDVFVEVPCDDRRPAIIEALATTRYRAKFRTGGVRAELHPDEAELASAIKTVVDAEVPFKATAGLHHAIRNTDPETGFEQHGFLNVLLAADAAVRGASAGELSDVLAERDGAAIAARVEELDGSRADAARAQFVSFGTCSIDDPLTELVGLNLFPASLATTSGRGVTA